MQNLLDELIAIPSITPEDKGAQKVLARELKALGFRCQFFNKNKVSNLYARYGENSPCVLFAGHTDVVAAGPLEHWQTDPFKLTKVENKLIGRGVADMKGAIVAMLDATKRLLHNSFNGSLAFLITSGEEGDDFLDGTPYALEQVQKKGEHFDYCIVGEPSSEKTIGDTIKVGRRGSMSGRLLVHGIQGHVAYPHLAKNPIHKAAPIIEALSQLELDKGNQYFDPSSLQITNVNAGVGQGNVIPKSLELTFNIRYSTEQTFEGLSQRIRNLCDSQNIDFELTFIHNGPPFLTEKSKLLDAAKTVMKQKTGNAPNFSTGGGTSDGRFIAPQGIPLIELGLLHSSIHKANEWINKNDLETLSEIYFELISELSQ